MKTINRPGWSRFAHTSPAGAACVVALGAATAAAQPCAWELVTETGPSPRRSVSMVHDTDRDVIVLWGGREDPVLPGSYLDELWEFDGESWALVTTGG